MSTSRVAVLTMGPVVLVSCSYWLAMPGADDGLAAVWSAEARPRSFVPNAERDETPGLEAACELAGRDLESRLGTQCHVLIRPPYVLAGDLSTAALERSYLETIIPTTRALATCYFDREPDRPIAILMFSNDKSYRRHARHLDGRNNAAYYGYYQKGQRRIVLNFATGNGTLAHELTHALSHVDFPNMPEWFDEGLASLHEQSEFSEDGLKLTGLLNWRIYHLLREIQQKRLRSIQSLIESNNVRSGHEAVDYAHARYLCLYLQERRLLGHFYRKFRASVHEDPSGIRSLCDLLHAETLDDFDNEFRQWVIDLHGATRAR